MPPQQSYARAHIASRFCRRPFALPLLSLLLSPENHSETIPFNVGGIVGDNTIPCTLFGGERCAIDRKRNKAEALVGGRRSFGPPRVAQRKGKPFRLRECPRIFHLDIHEIAVSPVYFFRRPANRRIEAIPPAVGIIRIRAYI